MTHVFYRRLCCCLLLLLLCGCADKFIPYDRYAAMSRDDFFNAMRWKRFDVAASLMLPEHRRDFMDTFNTLREIHITDVRLNELNVFDEGRRFTTKVEMDYYLLPSVTVKTFSFEQDWQYFESDDRRSVGFLIVTPFPDFP